MSAAARHFIDGAFTAGSTNRSFENFTPVDGASLGLVPEAASSYMLQTVIGYQRAAELFFTAEWIDADRAVESGIAARQWPDDELLEATLTKAREIARQALARYMGAPNYRNNWIRLGFTEADLADGGSNRFLDAMVAWGDDVTIQQRIQQHWDAGANHVCIQPLHPERQPWPDLEALEVFAPSL